MLEFVGLGVPACIDDAGLFAKTDGLVVDTHLVEFFLHCTSLGRQVLFLFAVGDVVVGHVTGVVQNGLCCI